MDTGIDGIFLHGEKVINTELGDIYHMIRSDSAGFAGFEEAYFSSVPSGCIKDWKKHIRMTLNLVVPVGKIRFALYDDRPSSPTAGRTFFVDLSPDNYRRLTVSPGIWMAFQGLGDGLNLLLNLANLKHDPEEAIRLPASTDSIPFTSWVTR